MSRPDTSNGIGRSDSKSRVSRSIVDEVKENVQWLFRSPFTTKSSTFVTMMFVLIRFGYEERNGRTMLNTSCETLACSPSPQLMNRTDGTKWRSSGKASTTSRKREQSSRIRYFRSISSSIPSSGEHSKTINPGDSADSSPGFKGIENMRSVAHLPDSGTLNFRSTHIAVPSLSEFVDSQTDQSNR